MFTELGAVPGRVVFAAIEGVAVTHHTGGRVISGDGQGAAQRCGDRLGKTCGHTAADHIDSADAQTGEPVERRDGKRAALGQRTGIAGRAIDEAGFVDGQFTALDGQAVEGDRVIDRRRDDRGRDVRWRDNRRRDVRWRDDRRRDVR